MGNKQQVVEKTVFSTSEAAVYLGKSVSDLKYYMYKRGQLQPDGKIGRNVFFSRATLDAFKNRIRQPGRPSRTDDVEDEDEMDELEQEEAMKRKPSRAAVVPAD